MRLSTLIFEYLVAVSQTILGIVVHHFITCQTPKCRLLRCVLIIIGHLLGHRLSANIAHSSVRSLLHDADNLKYPCIPPPEHVSSDNLTAGKKCT